MYSLKTSGEKTPTGNPGNPSTGYRIPSNAEQNSRLVTVMSCSAMVVGAVTCLASVGVGLSLFLVGSMLLAEA